MFLLVDADEGRACFIESILKSKHYAYQTVNCVALLETAWHEDHAVQAVIMNHTLADKDLFAFTAYLRRKTGRHIPIIAYGAGDMTGNLVRATQAGIRYFLPLPLYPDDLLFLIQNPKTLDVKPIRLQTHAIRPSFADVMQSEMDYYFSLYPAHEQMPTGLYDLILQEVERPLIRKCLAYTKGNRLKAAALLGLNRNTLRKKMEELGID